jgi:DNA primase large subunit
MAVRGPTAPIEPASLFAEYPFLPGAESVLSGEPLSVRELLTDAAYARAQAMGSARILAAVDDPRGERTIQELAGARGDERYLSFLFARLVLAAAPSPAALRRWAVSEAKRAYGRLSGASADELEEVAHRLGYPVAREASRFSFELVDYLHLATAIRESDFRLASQEVGSGRVTVDRARAARLLQEAIRRSLSVPVPLDPAVVELVRDRQTELLGTVAERMPVPVARAGGPGGELRREWFPPCIRKMRRTLERGENLSHAGRFCLAAFLHRAGADADTIVDSFRGAPDFDEGVTRYQVDHITSHGGGAGYEPPECDTLRSHGLCARDGDPEASNPSDRGRDALCFQEYLRHPLQYYRIRGGRPVESPAEGEALSRAEAGARGTSAPPERRRSTDRR